MQETIHALSRPTAAAASEIEMRALVIAVTDDLAMMARKERAIIVTVTPVMAVLLAHIFDHRGNGSQCCCQVSAIAEMLWSGFVCEVQEISGGYRRVPVATNIRQDEACQAARGSIGLFAWLDPP